MGLGGGVEIGVGLYPFFLKLRSLCLTLSSRSLSKQYLTI
jgi:hypothetical protein